MCTEHNLYRIEFIEKILEYFPTQIKTNTQYGSVHRAPKEKTHE